MSVRKARRLDGAQEYYFSQKLEQVRKIAAQGNDVINLGVGSPDLPPAEEAIEAAIRSVRDPKSHGYASYRSLPELRAAIASFYDRTYGVRLDPATQILPLLGSKEGILHVSMAFADAGDEILVPDPGYPAYSSVARLIGAEPRFYDLTDENDWIPDLEKLAAGDLSRCRIMWLNYPHMPSGRRADAGFFRDLVAFARSHDLLLCHDNPYSLVLNDEKPLSLLSFDPSMENVIELNSLSKSFNMPGWRVGMACGAAKWIDATLQVKSNIDSGMFLAVQRGAIEALGQPQSWHDERNEVYRERRVVAGRIFDALGFRWDPRQTGLFLWAKAPEGLDVEPFLDRLLEEAHLFLVPGRVFGNNGTRHARLSLCAPVERLTQALERVKKFTGRRP